MSDVFDDLLNDMKGKSYEEIDRIVFNATLSAYLTARHYYSEKETKIKIACIMLWAICADGMISSFETDVAHDAFQLVLGRDLSFEDVCKIIHGGTVDGTPVTSPQARKAAAEWIRNEHYKHDDLYVLLVTICIGLVAANGEITASEENWLRQLIDI